MTNSPTIITVTGTKGKTTVVSVVAEALRYVNFSEVHVTTNGHYVNGIQKSTLDDSKKIWGFKTPTLSPGRYLCEFTNEGMSIEGEDKYVAVLEATFACARRGLGYYRHDVGVLLNVFDDHIDPEGQVKNRHELALAKSFVFSKVKDNGVIVFNADDEYVCNVLGEVPNNTTRLLPCGFDFTYFDLKRHLEQAGEAITIRDGKLVLLRECDSIEIMDAADVEWTYGGDYVPSLWNLMHSFGAMYGADGGRSLDFATLAEALRATHMDTNNGRLVVMRNASNITVIADYAHEKKSIEALADLSRKFIAPNGRLLGVVRLSHERPDDVIRRNAKEMGRLFDGLIVYDKIDGYWRHAEKTKIKRYEQIEGRVSQLVYEAASHTNQHVERIVREDLAIARAAEVARAGDVVVVIVNDDAKRSIEHIKRAFNID